MRNFRAVIVFFTIAMLLVACGGESESFDEQPLQTSGPSPEIEILAGPANSCAMADTTQSTVIDFEVVYRNMGNDSYMVGVLTAAEVGEIGGVETPGEGRDGEEGWGIYPQAYNLAQNTPITLEITVFNGPDETAPVSSRSSIVYDCSTGETISASFNGIVK